MAIYSIHFRDSPPSPFLYLWSIIHHFTVVGYHLYVTQNVTWAVPLTFYAFFFVSFAASFTAPLYQLELPALYPTGTRLSRFQLNARNIYSSTMVVAVAVMMCYQDKLSTLYGLSSPVGEAVHVWFVNGMTLLMLFFMLLETTDPIALRNVMASASVCVAWIVLHNTTGPAFQAYIPAAAAMAALFHGILG